MNGIIKGENSMRATKKKIGIVAVSVFLSAVLVIVAFAEKASEYFKGRYLIPCIDTQIEWKMRFTGEKVDVMYEYLREVSEINGTAKIWNKCVKDVRARNDSVVQEIK
jgi:hypothetical protein